MTLVLEGDTQELECSVKALAKLIVLTGPDPVLQIVESVARLVLGLERTSALVQDSEIPYEP